ncbi:MAG: TonB family protein [Muribaculaceae bacterium]|nr:TonB family protein [Muribaculaceae bacterium]
MAKDVDLSSQEWRDIVFEGKNKEFGAYTLRGGSVSRHNKAVVIVLVCLAIILVLLILMMKGVFAKAEEEQIVSATEQEIVTYEAEEEEIEEEEVFEIPEEPEEVIAPEEVANEQRITDLLIVQDDEFEKEKEVKDQEKMMENEAQAGAIDITEGTNDLNKVQVKEQVIAETKPVEEEKVYNIAMVEQKPEFAGGEAAMYKWLSDHINYPAAAAEDGVQGRVVVEFEVSKTGSIEKVRVIRGRHPALDKEALRVVKAMPKWNPGRNNGQPVKVTYTLPVTFKLQ